MTDIKHVLSVNPLRPVYKAFENEAGDTAPLTWVPFDAGVYEIGYAGGRGFCFRHRGAEAPMFSGEFSSGRPARHECRIHGFHGRRRLPAFRMVVVDGMGHRPGTRMDRTLLLGAAGRRLVDLHAGRHEARGAERTGCAHQLFRGRRLCPLGRGPGFPQNRNGRWRCSRAPRPLRRRIFWKMLPCTPGLPARTVQPERTDRSGQEPQRCGNSTATYGNGRVASMHLIPAMLLPEERSANITASSCATSSCCAAARASHRGRTYAPPIVISFRRKPPGNSRDSGWPGIRNKRCGRYQTAQRCPGCSPANPEEAMQGDRVQVRITGGLRCLNKDPSLQTFNNSQHIIS